MARTITDEKIKLSIEINGNDAQKAINDLEKTTINYKIELKELNKTQQLLSRQRKTDSEEYKLNAARINELTSAINKNEVELKKLVSELKLSDMTMAQLRQKATLLSSTLAHLAPETADWKRYDADLKAVQARMVELRGNAQASKISLSSMADGFNKYQGLFLSAAATVTGVVFSVQKIIDINGKLSDSQADVMKTTGMNKKEVDELTKSFGALETRTSRIDLLKIAEQGGRIGIAKAEIGDFVNVMNKASVALGDSFTGGAEEVSNKLGKIKFLFEETKNLGVDKAYNAIGSAINDLGANGVASEANIAEFTTRIGSLTDVLKPTIQETLALGTAFEESGIEAEVSARAYNIFMKQASTESAKFAQVMGISQKAVEDMINTNPLDFMMKFAEGMRGMDATETAKTLDFLGVNADGANKVIGAMGNNMARFRELIDLSNNSFASGTSLVNEYNIKNNNLAATLEKINKKVSGWFSSDTFIKWLTISVNVIGKFIGATEDANNSVSNWADKIMALIKLIAVGITTLFSYRIGLQLVSLWTNKTTAATAASNLVFKIQYYWLLAQEVATKALALTQSLLTFKISEVKKAYTALMASMSLNPWAGLIAIIGACVAAYAAFSESTVETNKALDNQILINNKISEQTDSQKQKVSDLVAIMKDENATIDQKKEALIQLQKIAGGYLDTLTLENIATAEGTRLIGRYISALDELANAQAILDIKSKIQKEKKESENKVLALSLEKKSNKNTGYIGAGDDGKIFGFGGRNKQEIQNEINIEKENATKLKFQLTAILNSKEAEIRKIQASIKTRNALLKKAKKDSKEFKELTQDIKTDENALNILIGLKSTTEATPTSNYNVPGGTTSGTTETKNPNSSQEEINKLLYENEAKYAELSLRLRRQLEDDKIAAMKDGAEKEIAIENLRFQREIEDLEKQKVHKDELLKMDEEIAKAKKDKDQTRYDALVQIRKGWHQKNIDLDNQVNQIIEQKSAVHYRKINEIEEKAFQETIKQITDKYDHEKLLRETQYNLELAKLGSNEAEKLKLKEEYNKKELEAEERKLSDLANLLRFQLSSMGAFNLLSPEDKDKMQKQLDFILNALSKIQSAKKGEDDPKKPKDLGLGNTTDILGFSAKDWFETFNNLDTLEGKMKAMQMAVGAFQQLASQFDQYVTASENAQLKKYERASNAKKQTLKKQLDSGMISQTYYNRHIEKLDKDLDRQKAELEYKQAKRQRAIAISNIIMSTAQAIIGIWAQFPKADFGITAGIMSGVVGALGAMQLATVLATPLPAKGYEKGLYGDYVKREQDGKVFQAQYGGTTKSGVVTKPTYFLTGENGPEMIIDKRAYASLSSGTRDSLLRELRGIKGYEQGLYNQQTKRYEVPATPQEQSQAQAASGDMQMIQMMMNLMSKNIEVLEDLRDNGVFVTNKDLKSMKNLRDGIKSYEELRNKAKQ